MSNDELLEILSETKDPLRVEPHLKKCFEGISKLSFTLDKQINAMQSSENEVVPFFRNIIPSEASGLVEKWLQQVEEIMRLSLRAEASKAIDAYHKLTRKEWVVSFPGQILLACSNIFWTSEVTEAIINGTVNKYLDLSNQRLEEVVIMVRGQLSKMARITLEALIVIDVHGKLSFKSKVYSL